MTLIRIRRNKVNKERNALVSVLRLLELHYLHESQNYSIAVEQRNRQEANYHEGRMMQAQFTIERLYNELFGHYPHTVQYGINKLKEVLGG